MPTLNAFIRHDDFTLVWTWSIELTSYLTGWNEDLLVSQLLSRLYKKIYHINDICLYTKGAQNISATHTHFQIIHKGDSFVNFGVKYQIYVHKGWLLLHSSTWTSRPLCDKWIARTLVNLRGFVYVYAWYGGNYEGEQLWNRGGTKGVFTTGLSSEVGSLFGFKTGIAHKKALIKNRAGTVGWYFDTYLMFS